jgi:hypothetical protein
MQKLFIFVMLASLSRGLVGCHSTAAVSPAHYDVLAQAVGYWEWDSTAYQAGMRTPTTQNFSRQLLFGTDSILQVQRNGKVSYQTPYHLSRTLLPTCGDFTASLQARVTFKSDPDMLNSEGKGYGDKLSSVGPRLCLTGVNQCLDAGAVEFYHWVDKPAM